jgi:hypothetical protein
MQAGRAAAIAEVSQAVYDALTAPEEPLRG